MRFLFLLFVIIPIIEIMLLIEVGNNIGMLNTVALVILTAAIGSFMLRQQGVSTLFRARQRLDSGELPIQEVAEGLLLAVGGALLITPGFFTDAIGFACLLPQSRRWLAAQAILRVKVAEAQARQNSQKPQARRDGTGVIIEGEYQQDVRDDTQSDIEPKEHVEHSEEDKHER